MTALGLESTAPAERVIAGVVGMVDATAAWWLERHDGTTRAGLTRLLTDEVWLLLDHTGRQLGLILDPQAPLPPV
jgi:hypothetical protein